MIAKRSFSNDIFFNKGRILFFDNCLKKLTSNKSLKKIALLITFLYTLFIGLTVFRTIYLYRILKGECFYVSILGSTGKLKRTFLSYKVCLF